MLVNIYIGESNRRKDRRTGWSSSTNSSAHLNNSS